MEKLKVGFVSGFMKGFSTKGLELFKSYQKDLSEPPPTKVGGFFYYSSNSRCPDYVWTAYPSPD